MGSRAHARTLSIAAVSPAIAAMAPAFIFPEIRNPILDKTGLRRDCPVLSLFHSLAVYSSYRDRGNAVSIANRVSGMSFRREATMALP